MITLSCPGIGPRSEPSRRRFITSSVLATAAVALFGCQGQTPAQVTQEIINGVQAVGAALLAGMTQIGAIVSIVAPNGQTFQGWLATIGGYVRQIAALAGQVQAGLSQAAAQPIVQQAFSIFNVLLSAVTGVAGIPSSWLSMLGTAMSVLKTVMSLLGVPVTVGGAINGEGLQTMVKELQGYAQRYSYVHRYYYGR